MKNRIFDWQAAFGAALIALSALFYGIDYFLFRDGRDLAMLFFNDLGFVFIEVLLVTLVLHRLLAVREKRSLLKKMNMVIGAFFSEVGTGLMRRLRAFDRAAGGIYGRLLVDKDWKAADFARMGREAVRYDCAVDCRSAGLVQLKDFLVRKRQFLLGLLENANLLEHESFTNLLWAVFHLTEELENRSDIASLPPCDLDHLAGDIKRAYGHLIAEWLTYMAHLQSDYPYLFSLAVRTNPFDPEASPVIRQVR
jgi:hypothetical protein